MKKRLLFIALIIFGLLAIFVLGILTAFDWRVDPYKVVSQVYKNELPLQETDEGIVQILVKRMMNKHLPGNIGWYQWIWTYEIKEINLPKGLPGPLSVVIYVKPFFPDEWANMSTFEIDRIEGGWIRVDYLVSIDDKGEYYELVGPFTGG